MMKSSLAMMISLALLSLIAWASLVAESGPVYGLSEASLKSRLTGPNAKQLDPFGVELLLARASNKDRTEFHGVSVRELLGLVPNDFVMSYCSRGHLESTQATCVPLDQEDTRKNLHLFCQHQLDELMSRCSLILPGYRLNLINRMPDEDRRVLEKISMEKPVNEYEHNQIQSSCRVLEKTLDAFKETVEFLQKNGQPRVEVPRGKWAGIAEICREKFL